MEKGEIIEDAKAYIKDLLSGEGSGHDSHHTFRVLATAERLAREENADPFIVQLSALLHDADDVKLFPETAATHAHAVSFMKKEGLDDETVNRVIHIIDQVSFKGTDSVAPDTIEGMCVQDADRLDAIGAIGIARAFSFGGSRCRAMYDPDIGPTENMDEKAYRSSASHTVNHFHEKLFLLKDMMNTESAKRIAEERDAYMHAFIDEFMDEWYGRK